VLLKNIKIDGFIAKNQKLDFSFADGNITIIYGINGSGKTTFLNILYAIFAGKEDILKKNNISKIEIEYIVDDNINSIFIDRKIEEENYYWGDKEGSELHNKTVIFLGTGRGISQTNEIIEEKNLWRFFQNNSDIKNFKENLKYVAYPTGFDEYFESLLDNISKDLYEYLNGNSQDNKKIKTFTIESLNQQENSYFPIIDIDTIEALLLYKYQTTIKATKDKISSALFKSISMFMSKDKIDLLDDTILVDKLLDNRDLILSSFVEDHIEFKHQIEDILDNLFKNRDYLSKQDILIKIILTNIFYMLTDEITIFKRLELFIESFNNFIKDSNKKLIINDEIYIETKDFGTHSLKRLSAGERHLLTFLATILLLGETKDFILIDEPEISLDIDWQEKLISVISKLAPKSQIIVTSHSSTIWGEYFDETIEINPTKS